MKSIFSLLLPIILLMIISSCKKSVENNGLSGKWKLIEIYDGYANGGNFRWNSVSSENSHILSFTPDGKYSKSQVVNGIIECSGSYSLQNVYNLEINSGCNTVTEIAFISKLSPGILILDRSGIEGVIKYKYVATK